MRRLITVAAIAGALCASASPAFAHALLERAEPHVGATVKGAPTEVRLIFSEAVEAKLSRVTLQTSAQQPIALAAPTSSASARNILVATIKAPLAPGRYTVGWRVVSRDSHVTSGDFVFTVSP